MMPYRLLNSFSLCQALLAAAATGAAAAPLLHGDITEASASAAIRPVFSADVRALDEADIKYVIHHQWWALARDLVVESHRQKVDVSAVVRAAVREVRQEADELLRTLDSEYGKARQVQPAFHWAQSDTTVFLTVKFTARWNAPGALEVKNAKVTFGADSVTFYGEGQHSNHKYEYRLALDVFDLIVPDKSVYAMASVGKMTINLRKRFPRKWPRLLADKKTKYSNMGVWMEFQEKQDASLSGVATANRSAPSCRVEGKLYCFSSDKCVAECAASCGSASAPGAGGAAGSANLCSGPPTQAPTITFEDTDIREDYLAGEVRAGRAKHGFDATYFDLYWGDSQATRVPVGDAFIGRIDLNSAAYTMVAGSESFVFELVSQPLRENATHLLAYAGNERGEFATPAAAKIVDNARPTVGPVSIDFHDTDGSERQIGGVLRIGRPDEEPHVEQYAAFFAKVKKDGEVRTLGDSFSSMWLGSTAKPRLSGEERAARAAEKAEREAKGEAAPPAKEFKSQDVAQDTDVPAGATHIFVVARNQHGEARDAGVLIDLIDGLTPCAKVGHQSCPAAVTVSEDTDPADGLVSLDVDVSRADNEDNVTGYVLYWGTAACPSKKKKNKKKESAQHDIKLDHVYDFELATKAPGGQLSHALGSVLRPTRASHLLLFARGELGEGKWCVSAAVTDLGSQTAASLTSDGGETVPRQEEEPDKEL